MNEVQLGKLAAAKAAVEKIQYGMSIGLGSGSTTAFFIKELGVRCREGLSVTAVASSMQSMELALEASVPLLDVNSFVHLDLAIDGADEVDLQKRMIKGGGGALLREKIIAGMSNKMIVIVDSNKVVSSLGKFPIAVEIVQFGYRIIIHQLQELGYFGVLRMNAVGKTLVTENGNYIYDITLSRPLYDPEEEERKIKSITGVVETGLFLNFATEVLVGYSDGHTESF